jgi:hypothetical protein
MFIIASSGRSGTYALCTALAQFSNYEVLHEPQPLLLNEAYLKHHNLDYKTTTFNERMNYFKKKSNQKYGESFRAPNLLMDIKDIAPQSKFLILVRNPLEYVISANSKQVFQKNDIYDQNRLIPLNLNKFDELSIAEKIAWHWVTVNQYLLDFSQTTQGQSKIFILHDLSKQIKPIARFLNVTLKRPIKLRRFLRTRPNSATSYNTPPGYQEQLIIDITESLWTKIKQQYNELQ